MSRLPRIQGPPWKAEPWSRSRTRADTVILMADASERRRPTKQTTPKGQEIPVPKRRDFDDVLRKLAPPAGRKRPAEKDPPPEQSR